MLLFPLLGRSRSWAVVCLFSLLSLSVLALAPPAGAQGSQSSYGGPTYSGGTVVLTHAGLLTTTTDYSNNNDGSYGGGYYCGAGSGPSGTPDSASVYCSGAITATFKWNNGGDPNNLPPKCVIVTEHCTVTWSGQVSGGASVSGSCTNPLGGSSVPATPGPGATWDYTRYTVRTDSPDTLTLSCDAEADAEAASGSVPNASSTGSANVNYSASVSPVVINPEGTTPDSSGNPNILVGQGYTAGLSGIPSALSNNTASPPTYSWTASDQANTFQSWSPTTPFIQRVQHANPYASYYVPGPGTLTKPTVSWYWNELNNTTATVSCTVMLTPPTGQGAAFSVTLTQKVTVQVPTLKTAVQAGYMQVNALDSSFSPNYGIWAGPPKVNPIGADGGMVWQAQVQTPQTPAFGRGSLEFVQLDTPNDSYTTNTNPVQTHTDPLNAAIYAKGLDKTYPYLKDVFSESTDPNATFSEGDAPGLQLTGLTLNGQPSSIVAASATFNANYYVYLMYQPPSSGTTVSWVTVGTLHWSVTSSATFPDPNLWPNGWSDYKTAHGSDSAGTVAADQLSFIPDNTFPSWKIINDPKPY